MLVQPTKAKQAADTIIRFFMMSDLSNYYCTKIGEITQKGLSTLLIIQSFPKTYFKPDWKTSGYLLIKYTGVQLHA